METRETNKEYKKKERILKRVNEKFKNMKEKVNHEKFAMKMGKVGGKVGTKNSIINYYY